MTSKIFNFIKGLIYPQQQQAGYPRDFAIIDFSKIAFRLGMKDDKNKIILRYFRNRFGNYQLKKYRYSEERVHVLSKIHKIPFFDKTKKDVRFPVHSRIMPGEVAFMVARW